MAATIRTEGLVDRERLKETLTLLREHAGRGITKAQLESKGIGAMVLATFGEDTIGSLPYDPTTLDSATLPYAQDASSSAEKSDGDSFTAKFARIGN